VWINLKCQKFYWLGTYEPAVQEVLKKIIQQRWICYDLGAHLGYFSLLMARLTGKGRKVFAFEPNPSNFSLLSEHIHLNNLGDVIEAVPLAISSRSGRALKGIDSFTGKLVSSSRFVELVSLDDFVYKMGHPEPNFIKIDVKGLEGEVLSDAEKILTQAQPFILCEVHNPQIAVEVFGKLQKVE